MAHGALSTLRQKAVAVAPALVGLLAVAVVMGVAGVAMATEPPAPTLQTFDLEFDQIIDAMITRMTEYVVPLIMLALGLTAIGIFIGWLKGASHSR